MKLILSIGAMLAMIAIAGCDRLSGPAVSPSTQAKTGSPAEPMEEEHQDGTIELTDAERQAAGIRVEALSAAPLKEIVSAPATVHPNLDRIAHVSPRVAARVASVHAQIGERVRAGQTLAILDSIEVGDAHSAYLQASSELELARTAYERAERLNADQIVSQKDYIRARTDHERAKAAFRAAEDRLRLLGLEPKPSIDGKAVSTFPLRSAIAGTVTEKHAIVGEVSGTEDSLFTVADLSVLWIEASLGERDLGRIRPGAAADVRIAAYPDSVFHGRVSYIGDMLDRETRTVPVRIEVANADRRLKPEMFATVDIEGVAEAPQLAVPAGAAILLDGTSTVFIEAENRSHFEARAVRLGPERRGRVVLIEGVREGERVVVAGAYELKARLLKSKLGEGHAH